MPELRQQDYETMLATGASQVPVYLRDTFLRLGKEAILLSEEKINPKESSLLISIEPAIRLTKH